MNKYKVSTTAGTNVILIAEAVNLISGDSYSILVDGVEVKMVNPVTKIECLTDFKKEDIPSMNIEIKNPTASTPEDVFKKTSDERKKLIEDAINKQSKIGRGIYTYNRILVFLDKLYNVALEKEMWDEATSIQLLKKNDSLKVSRKALTIYNKVDDYEVIIKEIHKLMAHNCGFPIDEFWRFFNRVNE